MQSWLLAGHKAFLGMLYVEVTQNNPIVLTFIELLVRGATNRKGASKTSSQLPLDGVEEGEMTTIQGVSSTIHYKLFECYNRSVMTSNYTCDRCVHFVYQSRSIHIYPYANQIHANQAPLRVSSADSLDIKFHIRCARHHIDGLVPERRNSSALAIEICLTCTNPSILNILHNHMPANSVLLIEI